MSTWLGKIQFGLVSLDVSLERAVLDRSLNFNQFDKNTKQKISRKTVNQDGDEVPLDDVIRGFTHDDKVVLFTDEEFKGLKGNLEHSIEILSFIPNAQLPPHTSLGNKYYVLPRGSGKLKNKSYKLLVTAMYSGNVFAIVRYVLRSKSYVGICRVEGSKGFEYLTISALPYADEVVDVKSLSAMSDYFQEDIDLEDKMVKQASALITSMTEKKFVHEQYRDEFRDKVLTEVERKLTTKSRKEKSNVVSITRNRKKAG
jgi:Ku protein